MEFPIQQELISKLEEVLKLQFGDSIVTYEMEFDMPHWTVKKDKITNVLQFLRDYTELPFEFLTDLCGVHYPDQKLELGVVYHLHCFKLNQRIRIKTFTTLSQPAIPSACEVYNSANWMERETYDFYGIIFEGHPNLKRILNVDDMKDFPMRKDFPLEDQTREDKNDSMFGR